jgi:hypothetical protein
VMAKYLSSIWNKFTVYVPAKPVRMRYKKGLQL